MRREWDLGCTGGGRSLIQAAQGAGSVIYVVAGGVSACSGAWERARRREGATRSDKCPTR